MFTRYSNTVYVSFTVLILLQILILNLPYQKSSLSPFTSLITPFTNLPSQPPLTHICHIIDLLHLHSPSYHLTNLAPINPYLHVLAPHHLLTKHYSSRLGYNQFPFFLANCVLSHQKQSIQVSALIIALANCLLKCLAILSQNFVIQQDFFAERLL